MNQKPNALGFCISPNAGAGETAILNSILISVDWGDWVVCAKETNLEDFGVFGVFADCVDCAFWGGWIRMVKGSHAEALDK